jgi:hypothetical protein
MRRKLIALAAALFLAVTVPAGGAQAEPVNVAGFWRVSMQGQSVSVSQTLSNRAKSRRHHRDD